MTLRCSKLKLKFNSKYHVDLKKNKDEIKTLLKYHLDLATAIVDPGQNVVVDGVDACMLYDCFFNLQGSDDVKTTYLQCEM